jgi:sugar phosphate isomerase/epimerase
MLDVALSTMWAIGRFPGLADFFEAGRQLGVARFELNHAINSKMLDGLALAGTVASIHEPCPADVSMATLKERNWLVSAPDEENRRRGVAAIRHSIDLAHALGVPVLVVHPGRVDLDPSHEAALLGLYRAGRKGQPDYVAARERFAAARAGQAETNMRSVRRSLLELMEYAASRDVRLALENRYHYGEIPLPDELEDLLGLAGADRLGYWHDVGHAQVLENLGFGTHEEWLRRFSGRIAGVHLHDVVGIQDHLAPGLGEMDWNRVAAYLPPSALRTCEVQPFNSPDQVAAGLELLACTTPPILRPVPGASQIPASPGLGQAGRLPQR